MINNRLYTDIINIIDWANDNARPASDLWPVATTVSNEVWCTPYLRKDIQHVPTLPQLLVMPVAAHSRKVSAARPFGLSEFIQDEIREISTLAAKEEAEQRLAMLALFLTKLAGSIIRWNIAGTALFHHMLSQNHALSHLSSTPSLSERNRYQALPFTPLVVAFQTLCRCVNVPHDVLSLRIKRGEQYITTPGELVDAFKEKCELTVEKPVIFHYFKKDGRTLDLRHTALAFRDAWKPELARLVAQSVNLIVPEVGHITAEDILTLLPVLPPSLAGIGADFHS